MKSTKSVFFLSIIIVLLLPLAYAQFRVELSEENITGLTTETKQTTKVTIFNEGEVALWCSYNIQGVDETLTAGLSPGSSSGVNIKFTVPEDCREPCAIPVHVSCYNRDTGELVGETDVSFDLYGIQVESTFTRLSRLFILLLILGIFVGFIFGIWKVVGNLTKKGVAAGEKVVDQEPGKRKLSAIMFTDMKGYSKEMGADEEKTLKKVWRYEKAMRQVIKEHEGRVVKTIGDAIMGDFDSAVNAVRAAVEIQQLLAKEEIKIRIGIQLGDVIHKGGDIFGDGVNIASRIESICEPGKIYISEDVYNQVRDKIKADFENLGVKPLKNIDRPPKVFRIK